MAYKNFGNFNIVSLPIKASDGDIPTHIDISFDSAKSIIETGLLIVFDNVGSDPDIIILHEIMTTYSIEGGNKAILSRNFRFIEDANYPGILVDDSE